MARGAFATLVQGRSLILCILFALGTSSPFAFASDAPDAQKIPAPGELEVEHSRLYVFVDKKGLGHVHAMEARLTSGEMHFDTDATAGNVGELIFDMTSFDADTTRARRVLKLDGDVDESTRNQVNENMHGAAILSTQKFPTARYEIKSIQAIGKTDKNGNPLYNVVGQLTLRGVTREIAFIASRGTANGWTRVTGRFTLRQTDFGIEPFTKGLGLIGVANDLEVYGDLIIMPETTVPEVK